eukprot:1161785-Pelagomonas_calceolata.AAC.15
MPSNCPCSVCRIVQADIGDQKLASIPTVKQSCRGSWQALHCSPRCDGTSRSDWKQCTLTVPSTAIAPAGQTKGTAILCTVLAPAGQATS